MCGRYAIHRDPQQIASRFRTRNPLPNIRPRFNAAPTQELPVVRYNPETKERSLDLLRWGLVPHWATDTKIAYKTINARAEGIEGKPTFRDAFKRRRCLVPADAFFEWKKAGRRSGHTRSAASMGRCWRWPVSGRDGRIPGAASG